MTGRDEPRQPMDPGEKAILFLFVAGCLLQALFYGGIIAFLLLLGS